jgi:pimeloyl-ACP methyl ester carboxylesterase
MARFIAGEVRIAYDVVGSGPQSLVVTPGWVSHLDHDWSTPEIRGYYEQLSAGVRRVIRYDKRGTGLSDRPPGIDAYSLDK